MNKTKQEIEKIIFNSLKSKTKISFDSKSDITKIGIDSLDLVELIIENEEKFNVEISDDELLNLKTVEEVINLFDLKINKKE